MNRQVERLNHLTSELRLKVVDYNTLITTGLTPLESIEAFLNEQIRLKEERITETRKRKSNLPRRKTLVEFDFKFQTSVTKEQMNRLMDCTWIDEAYNIMFLGPPSVGKTHLSTVLAYEALEKGYTVAFVTLVDLIHQLKTQEISSKSRTKIKHYYQSQLIVIDEVGFLPVTNQEANHFFTFVSDMYEKTSIIITSNKSFSEWAGFLGDEVITTALLDRLIFKSEIFNMSGDGYRVKHRKTIL